MTHLEIVRNIRTESELEIMVDEFIRVLLDAYGVNCPIKTVTKDCILVEYELNQDKS